MIHAQIISRESFALHLKLDSFRLWSKKSSWGAELSKSLSLYKQFGRTMVASISSVKFRCLVCNSKFNENISQLSLPPWRKNHPHDVTDKTINSPSITFDLLNARQKSVSKYENCTEIIRRYFLVSVARGPLERNNRVQQIKGVRLSAVYLVN